jgi:circadian clock protein KaiC
LDEALGGGLPEGYVLLLEGGPGTMRSSLAFWILAHAATNEARRGIFLAFEESAASMFGQMTSLGVPLPATSERLIIADPAQLARLVRGGKQDWLDALRRIVEPLQKDGLSLLVIDPLASLDGVARFRERPAELLRLFDWLRDSGLTSIIVADHSEADVVARDGRVLHEADFLSDGIVQLRLAPVGEHDVERRLRILKLRGVRHLTDEFALFAGPGRLEVSPVKGRPS